MADSNRPAHGPPIKLQNSTLKFDRRTLVMGIINVTDESFSGDGLEGDTSAALQQAQRFVEEGADILDVGAESTRPGSEPVPAKQELERTIPVIDEIKSTVDVPVSIDTQKPEVAIQAVDAGADIINDVNGLRTEGMTGAAAQAGVPVIMMHMQGTPATMQQNPQYEDVVDDITAFFRTRIEAATAAGVDETNIIIDPGFGFGKEDFHNLRILRRLGEFRRLGRPIIIGTSRKSTIGRTLDLPVDERLFGTAATSAVAIMNGADIIRVHDVRQMVQIARMTDAILRA